MLHAEGHGGILCFDSELFKKASEVRVGDFIVDHEAGVDRHLAVVLGGHDGVGVATDVVVFFKKSDLVMRMQKMSAGQSGNSASYNGNALAFHLFRWQTWPLL